MPIFCLIASSGNNRAHVDPVDFAIGGSSTKFTRCAESPGLHIYQRLIKLRILLTVSDPETRSVPEHLWIKVEQRLLQMRINQHRVSTPKVSPAHLAANTIVESSSVQFPDPQRPCMTWSMVCGAASIIWGEGIEPR